MTLSFCITRGETASCKWKSGEPYNYATYRCYSPPAPSSAAVHLTWLRQQKASACRYKWL